MPRADSRLNKQVTLLDQVKDMILQSISQINMPREVVLVNARLGLLFRLLQVGVAVVSFLLVWTARWSYKDPIRADIEFLPSPGNVSSSSVDHCTNFDDFRYIYDDTWRYEPTACEEMRVEEASIKGSDTMFFMTLVQDKIVRAQKGVSACSRLEANCETSEYTYAYRANDGECECFKTDSVFVKNPEKNSLFLEHSFSVEDDGQDLWGSSRLDFYRRGTAKANGQMRTRIVMGDGTPCQFGNHTEWLSQDGPIGGTLEEWLACGAARLDDTSDDVRSFVPEEEGTPRLRTSGAMMSLEFRYSNQDVGLQPDIGPSVYAKCEIVVKVEPAWQLMTKTDFSRFEDPSVGINDSTGSRYRFRQAQGVLVSFGKAGGFAYLDYYMLFSSVLNCVVLFTVPTIIVRFIAIFGIGALSNIYECLLKQRFALINQLHFVGIHMMLSQMTFRALTNQWDAPWKELKPISVQDLNRYMQEAFHREQQNGYIASDDIWRLARVLLVLIDETHSGDVTADDWMLITSSTNIVCAKTMLMFFDRKRWRHPLERALDVTTVMIKEVTDAAVATQEKRKSVGGEGGGVQAEVVGKPETES